ncbi:unnamed protein product [Caretta caretta]
MTGSNKGRYLSSLGIPNAGMIPCCSECALGPSTNETLIFSFPVLFIFLITSSFQGVTCANNSLGREGSVSCPGEILAE